METETEPAEPARAEAEPLPLPLRGPGQFAWTLAITGAVGLLASFALTLEYLHKLQAPDEALICDLNPFITCGPAMLSDAAHVLGFPNVILGLVCFTVVLCTAAASWAGARLRPWYWRGLQLGLLGATALISYLQWFSVFQLGRLCLWCMIVWAATIPLVVATTVFNLAHGHLGERGRRAGARLAPFTATIAIVWYLVVIGVILGGMRDAFGF